jgi:hypothetical protein
MKYSTNRLFWIAVTLFTLAVASTPMLAQGNTAGPGTGVCCVTSTLPTTAAEAKWLGFMREEEKLARDVYAQLYAKWKLRLFDNIGRSEERHYESIGVLLARHAVVDPTKGLPAGVYTDAGLNSLYAALVAKGLTSAKDALEVGIAIEKQDIADLESAVKETDKTDIKTVYTNLMTGSLSHLESFEQVFEILAAAQ